MPDKDTMTAGDWIRILLLSLIALVAISVECGCVSQSLKPDNTVEPKLDTTLKNQQAMKERIETLNGNLTKMQATFNEVTNEITTMIKQKFETLNDSFKTGDVGGDVESKKTQNSTLYGIGLVGVVLIFVLLLIWLLSKIGIQAVKKLLR